MPLSIGIISDFNSDNLVRMFEKHALGLDATVAAAPYGQVMQTLLEPSAEFWTRSYDVLVLWTFPGSVVPAFKDVLEFGRWSPDELHHDVDLFADAVRKLSDRAGNVFVPTWVVPASMEHRPSIEMNGDLGAATALMRMNLRLVERLAACPAVVLFNTERWLRHGGPNGYNDKLWYLSKTPYSPAVFDECARDMVSTWRGLAGLRKKLVILDLDNTVWGGVVGDVGVEGIQLGGHDPVGEAYRQFQKELKLLSRQGVALAVVSKNEETTALEAIETHPEMELRMRDLVAWRINWDDKAQNIVELVDELNLGLESAVFIDDSPHERSRVRQALPDVLVPDWPSDPMDYARTLRALRCFEGPPLSSEDRARTAMYVADRQRKALQMDVDSMEAWLEMLELALHVEPLSPSNLERTSQLLNKTNQMNLSTRRLSAQQLAAWAAVPHNQLWTFRAKDKLGDYGLCGIASFSVAESGTELVDFVLSCRAMGRGIEDAIITVVARKAREMGAQRLTANYVATPKNQPCIRWIEKQSWFTRVSNGYTFLLDTSRDLPPPKHIRISPPLA